MGSDKGVCPTHLTLLPIIKNLREDGPDILSAQQAISLPSRDNGLLKQKEGRTVDG